MLVACQVLARSCLCKLFMVAHQDSTGLHISQSFHHFIQKSRSKFWHRRKHSVEFESDKVGAEFDHSSTVHIEKGNLPVTVDTQSRLQDRIHDQETLREEWAATRIQTAFRGFLVPTRGYLVLHIMIELLYYIHYFD